MWQLYYGPTEYLATSRGKVIFQKDAYLLLLTSPRVLGSNLSAGKIFFSGEWSGTVYLLLIPPSYCENYTLNLWEINTVSIAAYV